MWDHFVFTMWDHFVLQYLCGTTLYCISTYVGPLCIALFTSPVPMWDHIVLYQYLCGTTLYCTVYFTSTYVDHFVLYQYLCGTTLYCTVYLIRTYVGPLCIATVGICLISRPTYMWDHFVLYCDCLPHQYLCVTTLYCTVYLISTYVGPLCISTYVGPLCLHLTSTYVGPLCIVSVPMWDHFVLQCLLHQYLRGPLCIASVPMWDHFVLHCLPHQYLCGTTLYSTVYLTSTYVGPLCIATVPHQ